MATPEPLSPFSQTGEVVVLDEPPSQGADDHPYSHHPQTSSRRGGSSRRPRGVHASLDATLAPEMLRVHENIRDILVVKQHGCSSNLSTDHWSMTECPTFLMYTLETCLPYANCLLNHDTSFLKEHPLSGGHGTNVFGLNYPDTSSLWIRHICHSVDDSGDTSLCESICVSQYTLE
ncbi:hypothetical protein GWK47_026575 [Chionoecetes opilio]|uniref:Uncharacterized protein n=1 Tax=Chionoecetes opilio TaxID=41210 RepID=A0A8J8WNH9_CHIOP|nr:hypothetical protein GWK47_026575 [Chionoecetes opilio]